MVRFPESCFFAFFRVFGGQKIGLQKDKRHKNGTKIELISKRGRKPHTTTGMDQDDTGAPGDEGREESRSGECARTYNSISAMQAGAGVRCGAGVRRGRAAHCGRQRGRAAALRRGPMT